MMFMIITSLLNEESFLHLFRHPLARFHIRHRFDQSLTNIDMNGFDTKSRLFCQSADG
jgi:hypothetical protein